MRAYSLLLVWFCSVVSSSPFDTPCDQCGSQCANTTAELPDTTSCRCDSQCETYGDCCADGRPSSCGPGGGAGGLEGLQCRRTANVFLPDVFLPDSLTLGVERREAYWMVSACPDHWVSSSELPTAPEIETNCTTGSEYLPPVSDSATGVVYRNEFCAVCNGVENAVRWRYGLGCTAWLQIELKNAALGIVLFELTLEVINRECVICSYEPPNDFSLDTRSRACYPHVSTCLPSKDVSLGEQEYEEAVELCMSEPLTPVCAEGIVYRNTHCARCNNQPHTLCAELPEDTDPGIASFCTGEAEARLEIQKRPPSIVIDNGNHNVGMLPLGLPFSAVLDVRGSGVEVTIMTVTTSFEVECGEGEVYDPALQDCRPVVCREVFQSSGGGCSPPTNTTNNSCLAVLIQLTEDDDFEVVDNTSVMYGDGVYDVVELVEGYPVICINLSMNGTATMNETTIFYSYPTAYLILTYIGCSLSLVGVTIILLSLAIFKELQTLSMAILANLAVAMLVTNLFILVGGPIAGATQSHPLCVSVSVILHYCFLAQFCWMTSMSVEILRALMRGVRLRVAPSRNENRRTFLVYFIVGWGLPLVIVGATLAVNYSPSTSHLVLYGRLEDGTDGLCWINHTLSAVIAFVVPISLSLLINLAILVVVSVILVQAVGNRMHISHSAAPYAYVRVYCAVFFSTGATWVFGFIAIVAARHWAWYPFIVLNSVQGFALFLAFMLTKKVGVMYLLLCSCGRLDLRVPTSTSGATGKGSSSSSVSGNGGTKKGEKNVGSVQTVNPNSSHWEKA